VPAVAASPHLAATFFLNIDLVGPLQYSGGFNFIFTLIDRSSKWMEAVPLSDTSAAACAKTYIFSWISCFGVPELITSDREKQFTSNIWSQLCEKLHISHRQTAAYHPELNGAVERLHCSLKDALHVRAAVATWFEELPFVFLGLHAQPREDTSLPRLRQFLALQLSCPTNFCKEMNFLLMQLYIKNF
jgi:cleavage and polyadenylation specificity factor subunit 1